MNKSLLVAALLALSTQAHAIAVVAARPVVVARPAPVVARPVAPAVSAQKAPIVPVTPMVFSSTNKEKDKK